MKRVLLLSCVCIINAYAMQSGAERAKKAIESEYKALTKEKNARGPWRDIKSERMVELLKKIEKNQEDLAAKQAETDKKLEIILKMVTNHTCKTQIYGYEQK